MRCEADKTDRTTFFVLIGRSHGKLGRLTVHLLPPSSDEMRSDKLSDMNAAVVLSIDCVNVQRNVQQRFVVGFERYRRS